MSMLQLARLKKRLDREQRARAESEAIAEKALSELYAKKKEVELLQQITVAANEASTVDGAMRIALDRVCAHTRWPVGHVLLKDAAGTLASTSLWHLDRSGAVRSVPPASEAMTFAPGVGLPGRVLAARQTGVDRRRDPGSQFSSGRERREIRD